MQEQEKICYKLLKRRKNGELHPLYVGTDKVIPVGVWVQATESTKTESGKVKSTLGELAYRPGMHMTLDCPNVTHIGKKMTNGELCRKKDTVWCECLIRGTDITEEIRESKLQSGVTNERDWCLTSLSDAHQDYWYYRYNTNSSATGQWIIAKEMKIVKILTDAEVKAVCEAVGVKAQLTEAEAMESGMLAKRKCNKKGK